MAVTGISASGAIRVARQVIDEAQEDRVTFLAAAVAYYGFVSVVPLFLVVLAVGSAVAGDVFVGFIERTTESLLTDSGQSLLTEALQGAAGRRGATVVGLAFLVWSGSKVFRGLDVAFSTIYDSASVETLPEQFADALVVLASIGVGVAAAASLGVVAPILRLVSFVDVLAPLALIFVLSLVFFPMFYVFPDVELEPSEVIPGTLFAAVGWTILAAGFRAYATLVDDYQVYGVLGAAILFMTWMYIGGGIIMLGAVCNAVLAGRTDDGTDIGEDVERPEAAPDLTEVAQEVRTLRAELDAKTVSKDDLEKDLKLYVRDRLRRGKARGWGPYLVLLYGTAMTLGAFYWLEGGWAIGAMLVVWLSTLGLYVLFVLVGVGFGALDVPGKLLDTVRRWRS